MAAMMLRSVAVACVLLGSWLGPASASVTDWVVVEGGRVRLVTAGGPNEDGTVDGALEIALEPGWKTYWRDPGDAGVPPQIDIGKSTNVADVAIEFPTPERFADGTTSWAGYKHSVAFPLRFKLADPEEETAIEAHVFVGICHSICVPVQATFSLDPESDPDNVDDADIVATARAALPAKQRPGFGAKLVGRDDHALTVEATVPAAADKAELFVAGTQGLMLGTPERRGAKGHVATFSVPILDEPKQPALGPLPYTLATRAGAVEGALALP
jgi:DsbC/DsbD-like thiol-disulfide interchange protein